MDVLEDFSLYANDSWNVNGTIYHFSYMQEFILPTMVLYGIFTVTGSLANIIVIITVVVNKNLHTLTNVFIAQLSFGDLLILICCMPFTITANYYFKYWPFGKFMCYFVSFAGCTGATISVCMLTVMCYERYAHLMNPLQTLATWNRSKVIMISGVVYIISIVRSVLPPILIVNYASILHVKTGEHNFQCYLIAGSRFVFWYNLAGGIIFYGCCVGIIFILYYKVCRHLQTSVSKDMMKNNPEVSAQRRNVVRMLVIMATSFAGCWLLINTVQIFYILPSRTSFGRKNWYVVYLFLARMCEYGNCVINPILYSFLSTSFQRAFIQTWGKVCPCLKKYSHRGGKYSKSVSSTGYKSESKTTSISSINA